MSTHPRPAERPVKVVPAWDTIVPALLILAAFVLAIAAWDDVFNGLDLVALQLAVVGAALLPRRRA